MLKRCFVSIVLLLALFSISSISMGQAIVIAQEDECIIPPSGPWPPCATGEGNVPVPADPNCVIPPSGPWPSCATGGTPPDSGDPNCVIPPSGAWPPCATGGVTEPTPEPTDEPEMTPEAEETPMPEESPMPDETEEPTPEPEETETPEEQPEEPDPVDMPDDEFALTSFDVTDITSREVILNFSYVNMPQDGYAPLFRVVDIDNCFDKCNENLLSEYPIIGNGWNPDGLPADGEYSLPVAIDNIFCSGGQTYMTTRLIFVMADLQLLLGSGSAPVDYAIEIPFEHTWCDD